MTLPYPWHKEAWQTIISYDERLPHALMLSGKRGLGKEAFAHFLASHLLCLAPTRHGACTRCRSCHLVAAATHPDKYVLTPQAGNQLVIGQIHSVRQFLQRTAHFDCGRKVAIILQAAAMNLSAANALLKILEEPPANKFILLVSHIPNLMLPTIRSRCNDIFFNSPSQDQVKRWLADKNAKRDYDDLLYELSEGAPLRIEELLSGDKAQFWVGFYQGLEALIAKEEDPLNFAHDWRAMDILDAIDIMLYYLEKNIRNLAGEQVNQQNGYRLYDVLMERRRLLHSQFNLNEALLLEECCIRFHSLRKDSQSD